MKSDKQFLEGVYQKAKMLKKEQTLKRASYTKYIKYSSVAALFIIVPLLFFNSKPWSPNNEVEFPQPRVMTINNPVSNFYEADYILIGETQEIDTLKSRPDIVKIIISVDKVFLGEINDSTISLNIQANIESEFNKGDRSLLFLYKEKEDDIYSLVNDSDGCFKELVKDVFVDKNGKEYGIEDIENTIKGED